MTEIERAAHLSVARGCGFAALGIFGLMMGVAAVPALSFKLGGMLTVIVSLVLLLKANQAHHRPFRETEVWMLLQQEHRPASHVAQRLIGSTLEVAYLTFAKDAAALASLLLTVALVLGFNQQPAPAW